MTDGRQSSGVNTVWSALMMNLIYPGMLGNVIFLIVVALTSGQQNDAAHYVQMGYGFGIASIFALSFVEIHRLKSGQQYKWLAFVCDLVEVAVVILAFFLLGLFKPTDTPRWDCLFYTLAVVPVCELVWDHATKGRYRWIQDKWKNALVHLCGTLVLAGMGLLYYFLPHASMVWGLTLLGIVLFLWIISLLREGWHRDSAESAATAS